MNALSLLQRHTVEIYALQGKKFTIERVPARSLLSMTRFDLFAKLYYIRHLTTDREKALEVYSAHILAFNPDLKEPGRRDKSGIQSFVSTFNNLIETFKHSHFNEEISLIPVGDSNVILDGAHRISALAYHGKMVTIARFQGVKAHVFTYDYFMKRGLSFNLCDRIALEMTLWMTDLKAACLWPSVRNKGNAIDILAEKYPIGYLRPVKMSFSALVDFIAEIYKHQPWTREPLAVRDKASHCSGWGNQMTLLLIDAPFGDELVETKELIRSAYGIGNHSVHITDTQDETTHVTACAFSARPGGDTIREFTYRLRHIYWLRLKIAVARLIRYKRKKV